RISTAAFDSNNQRVLIWDGKTLFTYEQQDANFKLTTEKNWSQDETDIVLAAGHGHAILATEQGQVAVLRADTLEQVKEHTFPDDQPRFAKVSPNGAYGAVLFHSGRLVVLDLKTGTPALSSIVPRRHNVTAIEFNDQQQLVMVRTGKRIETYDLGNASKIETDSLPYSVGENVARFGLDPVYKIFPKPGKVQDTISYVLTGKRTARIDEGGGLQAVQIEVDPWEPIWHGAVFIAVILTVSSLYIYRQDF
ncbi:MAG: hypothetical protein KDA87_10875, partial [Planctomycetales bacterium]|nr:hypothetical protein [Planctomycetales bacterium]